MSGGLDDLDIGPVVEAVRELVDEFVAGRSSAPAVGAATDIELLERLARHPSARPSDLSEVINLLVAALEPGFDSAGAGFLSYIPSGALPVAGLAAYLGAIANRYTGANSAGVVYTSERAHHSVEKAALIAGIASNRVRMIPTDTSLRLDCNALAHALDEDKAAGLRPMLLVATAGTTDTGAIDPLEECARLARQSDCWFHVDAAYGGFFQMTERGRDLLRGIELADSITVDAHKSLFLPFGIGGLIVRDTQALIAAHEGHGSYMQDVASDSLPQYYAMGPELTRPNRGLQMWLPLHVRGVDAFPLTSTACSTSRTPLLRR